MRLRYFATVREKSFLLDSTFAFLFFFFKKKKRDSDGISTTLLQRTHLCFRSGLIGLLIVFIVPSLLHLASLRDCEEVFAGRPWKPYLGLSLKNRRPWKKLRENEEARSLLSGGSPRLGREEKRSERGTQSRSEPHGSGSEGTHRVSSSERTRQRGRSRASSAVEAVVGFIGPYGGNVGIRDVGRTAYTVTWWLSSRGLGYFVLFLGSALLVFNMVAILV